MNRSRGILLAALVVLAIAYAAMFPTLRRMSENARRIERETDATLAQSREAAAARDEIEAARRAVEGLPSDPVGHLRLGARLLAAGRLDEARLSAETALRLQPGNIPALLMLAEIHHRAKRYELAISSFKAVLARDPRNARALAGLGWLYISLGWAIDARDLLEEAVKALPDDSHLRVGLALACLQHDDYDLAERHLKEVRKLEPDKALEWAPLIDVYLRTNRPADAIAAARDALRFEPNDIRLKYGMAQGQYNSGDTARAMQGFQEILKQDPNHVPARYRLALCYKKLSRPLDAQKELERVLRDAPAYEQTRLLLGQMYVQSGRSAEGQKLLKDYQLQVSGGQKHERISLIVSMNPKSADAHYQLAMLYKEEGDPSRMIAELNRATELAPQKAEYKKELAEAVKQRDTAAGAPAGVSPSR